MAEWTQYTAEGDNYIPVEQWGQDHWSTFAYIETVTVDSHGLIDNRRMRCNPRLHRELANLSSLGNVIDGSSYQTRLKYGIGVSNHDDWSCVEDMIAAGLIEGWFRLARNDLAFGGNEAKVSLTPRGQEIAARLRQHKAAGGKWSDFEVEEDESDEN